MTVRMLLRALGAVLALNACLMLVVPASWYAAVPGVAMTGPFNAHFVRDIGFAYLTSGVAMMLGASKRRDAAVLACAGAAWPALHCLLHVCGWIVAGFMADPVAVAAEVVGVVLPGALGAILAWLRMVRIEGEAKC